VGGAITGLGIAPQIIKHTIGIVKAYTTRVGGGPFPTELGTMEGDMLREKGGEYGATTGRPRRCGWFDAHVVKYAIRINGIDSINLTKLDVLSGFQTIKIGYQYQVEGEIMENMPASSEVLEKCVVQYIEMPGWDEDISQARDFDDLPQHARNYVKKIEELVGIPIKFIGVGMRRDEMILR
jgi:adenylosuccinate synthase